MTTKNETIIIFAEQKAKVNCDRKCTKAWGINNRPTISEDDERYKSDNELSLAPIDPGTYEGDQAKPLTPNEFPNKWCVRECERCNMSAPNEYNNFLPLNKF